MFKNFVRIGRMLYYPGPEFFLGLANAKCEKTREEKGKTSGEFLAIPGSDKECKKCIMA
jgi:hypothetical protein